MADNKQVIREAAVRLFNERGYENVSLRDIAREAGIAIGSLTYHFRKKEDLLDALLEDLHTGFSDALGRDLHGRELLANFVGLFIAGEENQHRYPFYFQNLTQIAQCSENVSVEAARFERELYGFYRSSLDTLAGEDVLRPGYTSRRLDALAYAMVSLQGCWAMGAGPLSNGIEPRVGVATALCALLSACLADDVIADFESICSERGIQL